MSKTTFSIKVSRSFAEKFRAFCDENSLSVGKFAETQLLEVMEDYYFGMKAQRILSRGEARRKSLADLEQKS